MSLLVGTKRALLRGGESYIDKVLGYGPVAYYVQGEKTGTVARSYVDPAQNGAYTGVTLGQAGIGDGNTCPYYDGTNDYTDLSNAAFLAAFSGATGSMLIWFLPDPASHADGTNRYLARFEVSVSHFVRCQKLGASSTVQIDYRAGAGTVRTHQIVLAAAPTTFGTVGFTWSTTATVSYYNGAVNNSLGGSGAWAGALATALIGAGSVAPANPYHGHLAHMAIWDRVLSGTDFFALTVP